MFRGVEPSSDQFCQTEKDVVNGVSVFHLLQKVTIRIGIETQRSYRRSASLLLFVFLAPLWPFSIAFSIMKNTKVTGLLVQMFVTFSNSTFGAFAWQLTWFFNMSAAAPIHILEMSSEPPTAVGRFMDLEADVLPPQPFFEKPLPIPPRLCLRAPALRCLSSSAFLHVSPARLTRILPFWPDTLFSSLLLRSIVFFSFYRLNWWKKTIDNWKISITFLNIVSFTHIVTRSNN